MAHSDSERTTADNMPVRQPADRHWRTRFIEHLAATSNVRRSAQYAGVAATRAYKLRRDDPEFARQWLTALAEGYLHLEMDVVRRLREGDLKTTGNEKFDFPNAVRLLAAHRDSAARGQSQIRDVSAAEVRASIDRKIEEIRRRMAKTKPDGESAG